MLRLMVGLAIGVLALLPVLRSHASSTVEELMATMSPEERVGQLVMVNFVGADTSVGSDITKLVRDHHVGAVHLSASNGNVVNRGDTAGDVARLSNGLQRRARDGSARTVQGREVFVP